MLNNLILIEIDLNMRHGIECGHKFLTFIKHKYFFFIGWLVSTTEFNEFTAQCSVRFNVYVPIYIRYSINSNADSAMFESNRKRKKTTRAHT